MIRRRRTRVARTLVCVLAALALFATGCGGGSTADTATDTATAPAAESAPAESAPVAEASLIADTVNGGQIDFGALEGQDVVLWFWAPW